MKRILILCLAVLFTMPITAQVKCNGGLIFKLEHKATRVNGNMVAVDFILTNRTGADIDINFKPYETSIIDNHGRTYTGNDIKFDFANTGYDYGMIPENTAVKLRCIVMNLDDRATTLPLMMMKYKCSLSNGENWILFARKVALTQ